MKSNDFISAIVEVSKDAPGLRDEIAKWKLYAFLTSLEEERQVYTVARALIIEGLADPYLIAATYDLSLEQVQKSLQAIGLHLESKKVWYDLLKPTEEMIVDSVEELAELITLLEEELKPSSVTLTQSDLSAARASPQLMPSVNSGASEREDEIYTLPLAAKQGEEDVGHEEYGKTPAAIDAEIKPVWAEEGGEDAKPSNVEVPMEDHKVILVETRTGRKSLRLLESSGQARLALAAATRLQQGGELEKMEGCDVCFGDVVYTFYTDRERIYLAGLADTESHLLIINGKEYPLHWDARSGLHEAIKLTGDDLDELAEMLERGDQSVSFDIC